MRRIQFWIVLGFGLVIAGTTALDGTISQKGAINAAVTGLVLVLAAGLEIVHLYRWMDAVQAALGIWMAAAPFVLAYDGPIAFWYVVLGLSLMIVGLFHPLVKPIRPKAL